MKFYENPSSGSRVVRCGQTDGRTDGQTDMTKLTAASAILRTRLKTIMTIEVSGNILNITIKDSYSSSTQDFYALQEYNQRVHHIWICYVPMPF